jgi:hypothetical protein
MTILGFTGFGALLVHDTGRNFLLASGITSFLLELPLEHFVLSLALRAGSSWHNLPPRIEVVKIYSRWSVGLH